MSPGRRAYEQYALSRGGGPDWDRLLAVDRLIWERVAQEAIHEDQFPHSSE